MRPRWREAPRESGVDWLKTDGFVYLAELELPDIDAVRRHEGAAGFRGHDEESLLQLGEQDRCLDRSQELLRTRRARARRRGLEEEATAARGIVEHRRQELHEASRLLAETRRELAGVAHRELSDRTYRRRKVILGTGEAVSLAVAFSAAFDVSPVEALLLSGAIALAFVVSGDLGGMLRLSSDRVRLASALDRDAVRIHPRYRHLVERDRRRWIGVAGCALAGLFAVAAVAVGVMRAANTGSVGLAAGLGLLTVALAVAAGLSSWQHASVGCEVVDHLQREEATAARRWRRSARARVLRRYDALGESLDVQWQAAEERGAGRMRLAEARCAFFRARHPKVFGHGVGRSGRPTNGSPTVPAVAGNGRATGRNGAAAAALVGSSRGYGSAGAQNGSAQNGSAQNGSGTNGSGTNGSGTNGSGTNGSGTNGDGSST